MARNIGAKILGLVSVLTLSFVLSSTASAQIYFEETFLPVYILENTAQYTNLGGSDSGSVPTQSGFGYDLRTTLGYAFMNQMVIGFTYQYYKVNSSRPQSGNFISVEEARTRTEWGPTFGFVNAGWRFLLTYIMDSNRSYDSTGRDVDNVESENISETRAKGSGLQFTIGYAFTLSRNFTIGPSLVYRSVTYSRGSRLNRLDAQDSFEEKDFMTKAIDAGLSPMISLIAIF